MQVWLSAIAMLGSKGEFKQRSGIRSLSGDKLMADGRRCAGTASARWRANSGSLATEAPTDLDANYNKPAAACPVELRVCVAARLGA